MVSLPVIAANKSGITTVKGKIFYYQKNGKKAKNVFKKSGGYYYYFGKNGVAFKGLKKIGKTYYYFDKKGRRIQNKSVKIKGKSYYFHKSGKPVIGAVKVGKKIWVSNKKGLLVKNITASGKEGADFNQFREAAGRPIRSSKMDSCNGPGKDGIYKYSNFTVYTYEEENVCNIQFIN
jgi:hypothetical protein